MKKLLLFLVLLYLPLLCDAQSLTVFKVDTTAYPAVKAKFYAIDDQGYQITNLSPSNFTVLENGIQRTVTNVTCPAPKPPVALSSVLVIDVSGSMAGNGLNIAKAAATVWVNNSLSGKSECAITSFNDENYFNQDFTTDKQTLITAINNLQAGGGTDYNEALLNPVAGGIPAAKTGRYKKIIVMLTDGMPGYNPDINNIITQANQNQIAIYAVTLGFQAPDCLKQITTQTGGMWFENVTTEEQAKNVYLTILHTAQGGEPCEIDWTSKTVCQSDVKVEVSLDNPQLNAFANYTISKIAGLNFQPISIRFKDVPPGVKVDSIRTVKAIGGDFNISNINVSNPLFDINPKSFSLKQGDSTNLTISFTPADSTTQFCKFEFVNDVCPQYFYATGTYSFKPPVKPTIRITFPNGGEQFLAGSDTVITWEGVTPQDTISLEYSSNNGAAWHLITNRATGLKYNWSQLPNIAGSQYLIRGKLKERDTQNLKDTMVLGMGTIETIALSGDGKYLATGGSSGRVYLWDFVTGTLLKSFTGHTGEIRSLTFSPDGNTIASAGWDKTIILWNVITGKRLNTLTGHVSGVNSVAYSPDGTIIASGSDDANIKIWDVNTGTNINTLTGHSNPVRTVAFSHDGLTLASGSTDNTVKLWDIKNKNIKNTLFCGNSIGVYSVVFSPDNKSLASSTGWGYIFIWDVKSGILKDTLIGHTQGVTSIIYSPDGRTLFSGSWDDTIKVWNVDSSSVIKNLTGHKSGVIAIALSADGLLLASGSIDNSIKIWDMNSGNNIKTLTGYTSRLFSIAISPDGKTVATGDINNNINIWDLNTGILLKSLPHGGVNWITSLAYSPDGNILASGNTDSVITLWDIKNGIIKDSLIENVWLGNGCIISFSPDGSKLASGQDNTARIWDLQSRTIIKTFNHTSTISTVSFSPDGRTLASGGWFAKIRFFDVNLGIEVKTFIESSFINSIAFRPDGSMLVSGNDNKEIKLWDVNSGTTLKTINGHKRAVNTVAFSPDGTTVASGSGDMTIKLWDVNSGDSLKTLYGHADVVNSIAYNPDGTKLASGSYDGTCIVWNLDSTKTIQSDTSDSPFSIIVPQGRSSDIDMGKVLIGSTKDSVVQAFIQNLSTFPLTIKNVSIIGTDTSDFKVNTGVEPFKVDANGVRLMEFEFTPTALGPRQALVQVETNDSIYTINITGIGVQAQLSAAEKIIDFGKVELGTFKDTLMVATITNIGTTAMQITNTYHTLPNDKDFTTIAGGGAFTLNPGDTAKLSLRFTANRVGRTSGGLAFDYNDLGSPVTIQLYGEGVIENIPKCLLMSGSCQADVGNYVIVPIILTNSKLAAQTGCTAIQTDLNFNSTLLYPSRGEPKGTVTNEVRTLQLNYPISITGSDTIGTIRMVAALGDAESTILMLENQSAVGGYVEMDTLSGIFKLTNICREGGTRLVNPDGIAKMNLIKPNPSSNTSKLIIYLKEKGNTSLVIVNMLGLVVMTVFDREMPVGENEFDINSQDLESGAYYLILRTPSEIITQKISIVK